MRAGTENVAAIVGMAVALKKNVLNMQENTEKIKRVSNLFLAQLNSSNIDYIINGHSEKKLPGNISISFKGKSGEALLHLLDLQGICASTGSACDSVNTKVSHVISAIEVPRNYAEGTIRISFGINNNEDDAIKIAEGLIKILRK